MKYLFFLLVITVFSLELRCQDFLLSNRSSIQANKDQTPSVDYTLLNDSLMANFIAYQADNQTSSSKDDTYKKNILSARIGGLNVVFGILYERLLTKFLGVEAGIGFLGVSLGSNIYSPWFSKNRNINMQIGVSQSWGFGGSMTYFPIGVNLMSRKNFRFSLDAGPQLWHEDDSVIPSGSLRIGKAF